MIVHNQAWPSAVAACQPWLLKLYSTNSIAEVGSLAGIASVGDADFRHARRLLHDRLLPSQANRRAKTRVARPKNTTVKAARTIRSMMAVSRGPPIIAISSASTA